MAKISEILASMFEPKKNKIWAFPRIQWPNLTGSALIVEVCSILIPPGGVDGGKTSLGG